jgi:hypothetical protein
MAQVNRRIFLGAAALAPFTPAQELLRPREPSLSAISESAAVGRSPSNRWATGDELINHLKQHPFLKERLGWKVAYCQHPMYLLAEEDRGEPMLGERKLPWGAPDAAEAVARIRRNLEALEAFPGLRLNYEFAAADLESIDRNFPNVVARMKQMCDKGALGFVNGGYSQCHYQVLGSESSWRDLEFGLAVYERLFGVRPRVFACQETCFTQQLPQILHKFGYTMISMPVFPWAMEIVQGPLDVQSARGDVQIVAYDEFVNAQALDGTSLPLYLPTPQAGIDTSANLRVAIARDMYGPPPVWIGIPDMEEVTRETYDRLSEFAEFVILEKALAARVKTAPPRAAARVFSYWSYTGEGTWAEELWRKNREAEDLALLAESISAMAGQAGSAIGRNADIERIWHAIIKYHHHDVSWTEVTDLRRKAIDRWAAGITESREIVRQAAEKLVKPDQDSIAIFNALAVPRRALIEIHGKEFPAGGPRFQEFEGRLFGVRDLPAGGYKSFDIATNAPAQSKQATLPVGLTTADYSVTFSSEGLLKQITTADRQDLLTDGAYLGGEIRALINDNWVDNRIAKCRFYEGECCYVLVRESSLGSIPVVERYFFFKEIRLVKVELEFAFTGNEVGYYWLDETKMNVYYPTRGSDLHYDVAFGYVPGREQRPLFAINWLFCGGLTYVNRGTVKHWTRNGVIANVLAWGSRNFNNRDNIESSNSTWRSYDYDLRLYGKQKIEYALIPYSSFDGGRIVHDVNVLTAPVFVTRGSGERSFYEVRDGNLAISAVHEKDGKLWARGYRLPSRQDSNYRDWEIFDVPMDEMMKAF